MNHNRQRQSLADIVLITGSGRSGTNFLLDLLDQHPATFCRNEPNEVDNSCFDLLPSPVTAIDDNNQSFREMWDTAVIECSSLMGSRDPISSLTKTYYWNPAVKLGALRLLRSQTFRRIASIAQADLRNSEWRLPRWVGSRQQLLRARPVLKMISCPGWMQHAILHDTHFVIHIVRNPGGFLNSWKRRYLVTLPRHVVEEANRARLARVLATSSPPSYIAALDIAAMSVEEAELWYWRYMTELIHFAGQGSNRYMLVKYDDLVQGKWESLQSILRQIGLSSDDTMQKRATKLFGPSTKIAQSWKSRLSAHESELIQRVLSGSVMESWWSDSPQ